MARKLKFKSINNNDDPLTTYQYADILHKYARLPHKDRIPIELRDIEDSTYGRLLLKKKLRPYGITDMLYAGSLDAQIERHRDKKNIIVCGAHKTMGEWLSVLLKGSILVYTASFEKTLNLEKIPKEFSEICACEHGNVVKRLIDIAKQHGNIYPTVELPKSTTNNKHAPISNYLTSKVLSQANHIVLLEDADTFKNGMEALLLKMALLAAIQLHTINISIKRDITVEIVNGTIAMGFTELANFQKTLKKKLAGLLGVLSTETVEPRVTFTLDISTNKLLQVQDLTFYNDRAAAVFSDLAQTSSGRISADVVQCGHLSSLGRALPLLNRHEVIDANGIANNAGHNLNSEVVAALSDLNRRALTLVRDSNDNWVISRSDSNAL